MTADCNRKATLTEAQAQLLLDKNFAHVATIRKDGTPHLTPVWIDWDGECALFNTTVDRLKAQHLRRDPRVVVEVLNADNPYQYVVITGTAELTTDGAWEHIDKLSKKYRDVDAYPHRDVQRLIVRVYPERVDAGGFDD